MHKVVSTRRSVKVWLLALVVAVAVPLGVVWSQDYEAPTGDLATSWPPPSSTQVSAPRPASTPWPCVTWATC